MASKYWCFTLNNYGAEDETRLQECKEFSYIVYGREVSATGTRHLQGYVEFRRRSRHGTVKRALGDRSHVERRRGSPLEASEYCKKDGDFFSAGEISKGQGHRSDLEVIRKEIVEGKNEEEIADDHFTQWCQYRKSFNQYRILKFSKEVRRELKVLTMIGPSGVGKTGLAYVWFPDLYRVPSPDLKWFDGYNMEETVLIDDYRGAADECFLLQLLDIYPIMVPVKGGFVPFAPERIILTSNMDIPFNHLSIEEAVKRRIHHEIEFRDGQSVDFSNKDWIEDARKSIFE